VTPADLGRVVGDVKFEVAYERSNKPVDQEPLAQVQHDVERMVSILDEGDSHRTWN
jgi:hypothetical protein